MKKYRVKISSLALRDKVGYELMNAAFEKLSAYPKIVLWVLKGNQRAIRFYGGYGFHLDSARKDIKLGTPNTELRIIYDCEAVI